MNNERDQELERHLHAKLRRLPDLKAPAGLIPRVMAEIRVRANLPWWRRSWAHWPRAVQCGFLVLAVAVLGAVAYGLGLAVEGFSLQGVGASIANRLQPLSSARDTVLALANAAALLFRSGAQQLLVGVLGVALVMYLTCVGIGTACFRVALKRV